LSVLRDESTPFEAFRDSLRRISPILAYETLRDLAEEETVVQTPLESAVGHRLKKDVILVPILRAGLGMTDGFLQLLPGARVGHLGMYRDPESHDPVSYYDRMPEGLGVSRVVVIDPMLATGGSAVGALDYLKGKGATELSFCCLVAAPEGVGRLRVAHPDVPIVAAALDRELDSNAYIRPGLGDAGDRIYGTTH
jgi:uracil phosphoribosyltransferase